MALQLSVSQAKDVVFIFVASLYLTHPKLHRQSCLWSILPILWLPPWSRLPSCLPWLIAGLWYCLSHSALLPYHLFSMQEVTWLSKNFTFCPALLRMSPWASRLLEQNQVLTLAWRLRIIWFLTFAGFGSCFLSELSHFAGLVSIS